jgi:hypothetical protein
MKLRALLFLASLTAYSQTTWLDPFVGKDLWKLTREEQLRIRQLFESPPQGYLVAPVPWHVWATANGGQARYVVLFGEKLLVHPGGSSACIQLFDGSARKINSWSFHTGWRIALVEASIEYSSDLASDLVVLHTAPEFGGAKEKEYFAVGHDRVRLVRMENAAGIQVQNDYLFPNEIGVVPEAKTVFQWSELLESDEKEDVLSALVFLGGMHSDDPQRRPLPGPRLIPGPRESKYADLYYELLKNERIREQIKRLHDSDNSWIREAAVLATRNR